VTQNDGMQLKKRAAWEKEAEKSRFSEELA
jgi:hypothetical protein